MAAAMLEIRRRRPDRWRSSAVAKAEAKRGKASAEQSNHSEPAWQPDQHLDRCRFALRMPRAGWDRGTRTVRRTPDPNSVARHTSAISRLFDDRCERRADQGERPVRAGIVRC